MLTRQIIAAIGHALRLEPCEMVERLAPIMFAFCLVYAWPSGGFQISDEIFGAVFKTRRALRIGAATAADIDFAARKPRCAAAARIAFEQHHLRPGICCLDRRTSSGRAKSDNRNVGFKVPACDLGCRERFV